MRVSREEAARNRERILDAAAQLFRERGFDGIGVADLMKAVGLTHGGFYGHFSSKEDLMAQACARALSRSLEVWSKRADSAPDDPLLWIAGGYLSSKHRDNPGAGCVLAALGPDAAGQGPACGALSPKDCVPLSISWPSWLRINRSRQEDKRPSASTQASWARWSWPARSTIARFRRKS